MPLSLNPDICNLAKEKKIQLWMPAKQITIAVAWRGYTQFDLQIYYSQRYPIRDLQQD